jgi:hypothetical protein
MLSLVHTFQLSAPSGLFSSVANPQQFHVCLRKKAANRVDSDVKAWQEEPQGRAGLRPGERCDQRVALFHWWVRAQAGGKAIRGRPTITEEIDEDSQ